MSNRAKEHPITTAPRAAAYSRFGWLAVEIVAAIFILTFTVPWQPAEEAPIGAFDYSWMLVLHDAVATGRQFGKQIILPQGPLGFIGNSVYDPRTYPVLIAARSLIALLAFWPLRRAARKLLRHPLIALAWMLAVILLIGRTPDHFFPGCAVLLLLNYFIVEERKITLSSMALVVVLAASSLIKVNQPFYAITVVAVLAIDQAIRRNRMFFIAPLMYLVALLLFYFSARQRPSSLGTFLWGWGQVALGHADAVGLPGPWIDPVAYLIIVTMILALIARFEWKTRRFAGLLPAAGVGAVLLLLYKHSFMRQDIAHVHMGPMVAMATVILYLPVLWPMGKIWRGLSLGVTGLSAIFVASILGTYTPQGLVEYTLAAPVKCFANIRAAASHLTDPPHLHREWEAARRQLRDQNPLPLAKIEGTVDVYPHRQDVVLAYDLNYQPRPVISSLVATSTVLADVNTRYLRGPLAPQTVLFDIELVDNNYPTMLDGESLPELLTRYDVVDASGAMLVLRRSKTARSYKLAHLLTLTGRFNEALTIPKIADAPLWANIRLKKRNAGRLLAAIYKPPSVVITVHTNVGADTDFRLLPSLAEQGFLLSPLIDHRAVYAKLASKSWASDLHANEVNTLTLSVEDGSLNASFDPDFSVALSRLEFERQR